MTDIDLSAGQTGRSTRGRTPVWRFAVNGVETEITVIEARMLFNKNMHDFVLMTMSSDTMTDTEGLLDQPVSFLFGQSPRVEQFYGYIVSVQETSSKPQSPGFTAVTALQFVLVVAGATRAMQGGSPRFWRDSTISGAVEELVLKNSLGYAGQTHEHKWKSLAQTNESDWGAAQQLAHRLGWDLYNRYGVVLCYDPEKIFEEIGPYTSLVAGGESEISTQNQRLLLEFDATDESDETPESIGYKVGFFNGEKPQTITQAGDFKKLRFQTDKVIRDLAEATIFETAFNLADSYDTQRAEARLFGEADLYPGMSVDVTTSNARVYRGRFDGRWLIDSVSHKMDRTSFQTQLKLSRPGKARVRDLSHRNFWDLEGRSRPSMYLESTIKLDDENFHAASARSTATSDGGTWVSTWADRRFVTLIGGVL